MGHYSLSSKLLEDALNLIRKDLTRLLGKSYGRVVLKAAKPRLTEKLDEFRKKLLTHKETVKEGLQKHLDESRKRIIDYYKQHVIDSLPDKLIGQLSSEFIEQDAVCWLNSQLDSVFPKAETLIQDMKLEESYKDVTFETLNRSDFLSSIKKAYPMNDWEKTFKDFIAAG